MITVAHDPLNRRTHIDETVSSLEYFCPVCGKPLVTRKGDCRRHHFAHKPGTHCSDSWHGTYSDNEWHFSWQDHYPLGNREITLQLGSVKHRADVLVDRTVVEFQHSALSKHAFKDRNGFYCDLGYKVVWLYDLRNLYASGDIHPNDDDQTLFIWENPKVSFTSYDLVNGNADLFLQLKDDDGGLCIVQVIARSGIGFEEFLTKGWITADEFLEYTGLIAGSCLAPCLTPLEPNEGYLEFKERYSIRLDPQQERAVQVVGGACLLLAVPGSGKTTVLVDRLGYLTLERGIPPERICAITYGKRASEEMKQRYVARFHRADLANRIHISTVNSLANEIYQTWRRKHPKVIKRRLQEKHDAERLLRQIYKTATGKYASEAAVTNLGTTITWAKNALVDDEVILCTEEPSPHFHEMYRMYAKHLKDNGLMDFDDQMRFALFVLERDKNLLREYRERYRHWCVDEAQDTSTLQFMLIRLLTDGAEGIFMVGDEDQSIYGYRGACPEEMLNFKFVHPNAQVLKMERNYRSGKRIVAAASAFVRHNTGRFEKAMSSAREEDGEVRVMEVPTRASQYDAVIRLVEKLRGEGTLAIIYRDNEIGIPIIDRLMREGVPFQLLSKANTFFTSRPVREVKAFLRLAADPYDTTSFKTVARKSGCGIRDNDITYACKSVRRGSYTVYEALTRQMSTYRRSAVMKTRGRESAERFHALMTSIAALTPSEAIDLIMDIDDYRQKLNERDSHRVDLLRHIAEAEKTSDAFLRRLDVLSDVLGGKKQMEDESGVTLSTAHSSKGREYDAVVILDAVDGTFPSADRDDMKRSKDAAENYQEERRLFYVAMTRAKSRLVLLRPQDTATPFVDEVVPRRARGRSGQPNSVEMLEHPLKAEAQTNACGRRHGLQATSLLSPDARSDMPIVPRYRIEAWESVDSNGRRALVTNGDMDAIVSSDGGGRYVDMCVGLNADVLSEVSDHLDELTTGCAGYSLCVDISIPQEGGLLPVHDWEPPVPIAYFDDEVSPCLPILERLKARGVDLEIAHLELCGSGVVRKIEKVDTESRRVVLSHARHENYWSARISRVNGMRTPPWGLPPI